MQSLNVCGCCAANLRDCEPSRPCCGLCTHQATQEGIETLAATAFAAALSTAGRPTTADEVMTFINSPERPCDHHSTA